MKVLEIKNNLVKVSYETEDNLILGGFVVIEDDNTPYVAQIVSLKADNGLTYAIVKLIFTFNEEGIVKNYDGTIPALNANVTKLSASELLDILPIETPLKLGNLSQQEFLLKVDTSLIQKNLLICSDNLKNTDTLVLNFSKQLENNAESSIIIDTDGSLNTERTLTFAKDFKLPLNFDMINFIYANDLNDVDATSKAVIQDIFLEVQDYTRTIPDKFIPFDTFIEVVSQQYKESGIAELAVLKNKLLKYKEQEVFAQSAQDIKQLKEFIKDNYTVILNISDADPKLQREIIFYVYNCLEEMDAYIYSFVKIDNDNSDKKLLKLLLSENKVYTNIICSHNYKYVYELKEHANNLILFAPLTTQHDFASYNTFLNKLNLDEFIVYGKATQAVPLIVELAPIEIVKQQEEKKIEIKPVETQVIEEPTLIVTEPVIKQEKIVEGVAPETPDFLDNADTYEDLSDDIPRIKEENEQDEDLSSYEYIQPQENADAQALEPEPKQNMEQEPDVEVLITPKAEAEVEANDEVEIEKEAQTSGEFPVQEPASSIEEYTDEIVEEQDVKVAYADFTEQQSVYEELPFEAEPEIIESPEEPEVKPKTVSFNKIAPIVEESADYDAASQNSTPEAEFNDDTISFDETYLTEEPSPLAEQFEEAPIDEDRNKMIEHVSKDIDETFIYTKLEDDNIEQEDDVLTEDDLNFIDDLNQAEPEQNLAVQPEIVEELSSDGIYKPEEEIGEEEEKTPVVPIYQAEMPQSTQTFEQGDHVSHPKYGEGIVEKMIKYGSKTLCSINFVNVGRRLLDPAISEITKL